MKGQRSGRVQIRQDPHRGDDELRRPPGGKVGEVVADAISNPERMMREDLENFAARVERGEVEFAGPGAQDR